MVRKIITIDEEKCTGCGLCADACHEGAIGMVNGKAKLLREDYCDGLGDCLPADKPMGEKNFKLEESVQYTLWAKSDVPICACFGRLDVRQTNMAYYSVEGYSI